MLASKIILLNFIAFVNLALAGTPLKRDLPSSSASWRSQSIYQIVTDRFARTDGSTTAKCNVDDGLYCGGTYQGIIDKLDYIQGMGFTAIWISPIVENIPDHTIYGYAYHGYWMKDIYSLNTNFGTADELLSLAKELHNRGMLLMVDIVTNHYGSNTSGDKVDYSIYNPFNSQSYFHDYCLITSNSDQAGQEDCWEGDSSVSLPDLRTEDDDVSSVFNSWVKELVSNYSIDGLRIDSASHVDKEFYPSFMESAGIYAVGEVFHGDPAYTCPYQEVIPGVLNYPLYFPILRFFESTSSTSSELLSMLQQLAGECHDITLLGNFIENHDNPRFPTHTTDTGLIKNALAFVILTDGIPIIYYGQEQGLNGGSDPNNREALWLSGYSEDSEYYRLIAKANGARNIAINKDSSYVTTNSTVVYSDSNVIALKKGSSISVFSNLGSSGSKDITITSSDLTDGTTYTDVISCKTATVSGTRLSVSISGGAPLALVPSNNVSGLSFC